MSELESPSLCVLDHLYERVYSIRFISHFSHSLSFSHLSRFLFLLFIISFFPVTFLLLCHSRCVSKFVSLILPSRSWAGRQSIVSVISRNHCISTVLHSMRSICSLFCWLGAQFQVDVRHKIVDVNTRWNEKFLWIFDSNEHISHMCNTFLAIFIFLDKLGRRSLQF